jgi:hypothetical protein
MKRKTREGIKKEQNEEVIREVLADRYLSFTIERLNIHEDLLNKETSVQCSLIITNLEDRLASYDLEGTGKGLFDVLFTCAIEKLVDDCHSLRNLRLEEFNVDVDKVDLRRVCRKGLGADARVEASLTISNGNGKLIPFTSRSQSLIAASADVVCKTIEFFVNSERAVLRLKQLLMDADERNRGDLYNQYTLKLSDLVFNTSYEKSLKEE